MQHAYMLPAVRRRMQEREIGTRGGALKGVTASYGEVMGSLQQSANSLFQ